MRIIATVLLILGGGLLYLTLVKGQKISDVWSTLTTFFKPPSGGTGGGAVSHMTQG